MAALAVAAMFAADSGVAPPPIPKAPWRKKDRLAPKETKSAARRRKQIERGTLKVTP